MRRADSSEIRSSLLATQSTVPPTMSKNFLSVDLLQTIGDNSCPSIKERNIFDIVAEFTAKRTIIRPENKWLLCWHSIVMCVLIYYIFEIGLLWGYGEAVWEDELAVLYSLNCIFIVILIADCLLCNLKAYYSHGLLVMHPRLIVKRYLRLRVYIDILAILSVAIPFISKKYQLNWIKVIFLLKIYSVLEIDKEFIRVSQLKVSYHTFYLLSRLVLLLILGSHFLGILFFVIDYYIYETNYYGPNTPNLCWIYNAEAYSQLILLLPWEGQYLYTMYFSIGTMTTIAYGDITPLNPIETIYITFALIAYTIGFAYILSEILRILMEAQASKFEHTNNLLIVSNMMKNNMIKQKTQSKVKSYFEKVWKEEIYRNREIETELIQELPQRIRNELFSELYESFFLSAKFYYPGCECSVKTSFIVAIANEIREQRLVEDHVLYKEKEEFDPENLNNHIFYFIKELKKGKLKPSVEIGVKDLVIHTFTDGNIGIEGFYTGDPRDHWARVITSVLVYQLPRKILIENLHLATEIELENLYAVSSTVYTRKCYICKQNGHNFKECSYVTYQPIKKDLIDYYLSKENRNEHSFGDQKRLTSKIEFNTLAISKIIQSTKYKIRDKYQMMINDKYYRQFFSLAKKKAKTRSKDDQQGFQTKHNKMECYRQKKMKSTKYDTRLSQYKLSPRVMGKSDNNIEKEDENFMIEVSPVQVDPTHSKAKYSHLPKAFSLKEHEAMEDEECYSDSSSSESSDSSSSEDSVDLENYVKETELYIRHLEQMDTNIENENINKNFNDDIEVDKAKEFTLFCQSENISSVIKKYNSSLERKRRDVMKIKFANESERSSFEGTQRGLLNDSMIYDQSRIGERERSMSDIDESDIL